MRRLFSVVLVFAVFLSVCKKREEGTSGVEGEVDTDLYHTVSSVVNSLELGLTAQDVSLNIISNIDITGMEGIITTRAPALYPLEITYVPAVSECPAFDKVGECFSVSGTSSTTEICVTRDARGEVSRISSSECFGQGYYCVTNHIWFDEGKMWGKCVTDTFVYLEISECREADVPEGVKPNFTTGKISIGFPRLGVSKTCKITKIAFVDGGRAFVVEKKGDELIFYADGVTEKLLLRVDTLSGNARLELMGKRHGQFDFVCSPDAGACDRPRFSPDLPVCVLAGLEGQTFAYSCVPVKGCVVSSDEGDSFCTYASENTMAVSFSVGCTSDACKETALVKVEGDGGIAQHCTPEGCLTLLLSECKEWSGPATARAFDDDRDDIPDRIVISFGGKGKECVAKKVKLDTECYASRKGEVVCALEKDNMLVISWKDCSKVRCKRSGIKINDVRGEESTGSAHYCDERGCKTVSLFCSPAQVDEKGVKIFDRDGDGVEDTITVSLIVRDSEYQFECKIQRFFASQNLECDDKGNCVFVKEFFDEQGNLKRKRMCTGTLAQYVCKDTDEPGNFLGCSFHSLKGKMTEDFRKSVRVGERYVFDEGIISWEAVFEKGKVVPKRIEATRTFCSQIDEGTCSASSCGERTIRYVVEKVWSSAVSEAHTFFVDEDNDQSYESNITVVSFEDQTLFVEGVKYGEGQKTVFNAFVERGDSFELSFAVYSDSRVIITGNLKGDRTYAEGEIVVEDRRYTVRVSGDKVTICDEEGKCRELSR